MVCSGSDPEPAAAAAGLKGLREVVIAVTEGRILILDPEVDAPVLKGISNGIRLRILRLLKSEALNINDIAARLELPQSTVATNVMGLEKAGLVGTESRKARKGSQKLCRSLYDEIVISFTPESRKQHDDVSVEMPIGLFTSFQVSPPCGLCGPERIIGFLDVPEVFFHPDRVKAGLVWFERGYVEYTFPNNCLFSRKVLKKLSVRAELSSESLQKNMPWPSDITLWLNGIEIATWTSPGDFSDVPGRFTPSWWSLRGAQYGLLKEFSVEESGSFVDGTLVSDVRLDDLSIPDCRSIRVRIGVKDSAEHCGGINIFGQGFGNYGQGIVLSLGF